LQSRQGLAVTNTSVADTSASADKIAIASVGNSVDAEISARAGRAPYYLIFDENGVYIKSIKNPSLNRGRRASSGVVNFLKKEGVTTVIAGNFGNKMKNQLKTNQIVYYERTGIVKEVVKIFIKNKQN
jgi:predicted Fe-Mo cluster-binding NifX family protein